MPYNSGQGMYNLTMYVQSPPGYLSYSMLFTKPLGLFFILTVLCRCIVSAVFLVGSLRTNLPFACAFFGLVFLFAFIAASDFQRGYATSAAAAEQPFTLLKVAGGFGFITIVAGW
jgi:hypothetical protein